MKSWTSPSSETRRSLLLGAFVLAAAGFPAAALAQAEPRFSRVVIDTAPMAASGAAQLGENIKPLLAPGVAEALAGLIDPRDRRAPVLVISIRSLDLPSYSGSDDSEPHFHSGGGMSSDSLDTVVSVVAGRKVLSTFPLLVSQPSSAGGSWFLPNNEDRRVQSLGRSLGGWVRRKLAA